MNSIKQIEVIYSDRLVGRLALTREGLCAFEYSSEWLSSGFAISPFELPLRSGVFIAKSRPFDGGFGVFDDCLPDGWGLLILDRDMQQKGINPRTLTLLDRLALVGSTGRGALEFRPNNSVVTRQDYVDFEKLALEAEQILDSDDYMGEGIEEFQDQFGTHAAGQCGQRRDCLVVRIHEARVYAVRPQIHCNNLHEVKFPLRV